MLIEIDHHVGVPIYLQIIRQVRQQIMTNGLKEGEQIEPVRDLAARLKVNPMTVSKAYSFLEAEGLVERRRGVGLFVARVEEKKKGIIQRQMLGDVVARTVVTALQLRVSEDEVIELFKKHFRAHKSGVRRGKWQTAIR
ncbi:MAG: GntR family transcriptional regulator [Candidatus Abyssobacteria bacterium SURF_17]|jgi:GntR family transcriptional regulator|uniref:GntR family transcriptional regulator n=1 Tax=Candidatus Abyssobacteria bacterium SURF_17 TaxID=2093361 RepID=A0A419F9W8_9BACT|nr:MAG: GntR family transcriptional regulator [Candidatus Abyssubacteria bacterium SURF_17]